MGKEEKEEIILQFYNKLVSSQKDIDPEFAKIVDDNFFDLVEGE